MMCWVGTLLLAVPFVTIPLGLLLVHKHPQPVDDCPCFEDAIAFIAVVMGEILATWYMTHHGYDDSFFVSTMAGSAWSDWIDVGSWVSVASMKMVLGKHILLIHPLHRDISTEYNFLYRHPSDLCMAHLGQVTVPSDFTANFSAARTAFHAPSPPLLHACDRLHERAARERPAADPVRHRSTGHDGARDGRRGCEQP